jgi:putative ABC transport system permease protein
VSGGALLPRLLALIRARRLDRELDDEVQAHLELAERDAIAAGLSPEEARRTARRHFGHLASLREEHRDRRSVRWIETFFKDARHGLAWLARERGFAMVAIGLLALGIGANAAMFSVIDAALLRPLPFPEPDRLVRVWEAPRPGARNSVAARNFVDWARLTTTFEALAAQTPGSAATLIDGEPVRLVGMRVSGDYFKVMGVGARLGRTFTAADDQPGAARVVVLSDAVWRQQYGADPAILSRDLVLNGEPHRVIGVLPPGPFDRERASFWAPIAFTPDQLTRGFHWLSVVGRLKPGVTLERAQTDLRAAGASIAKEQPIWKRDWLPTLEPFDRRLVGDTLRRSLYVTFAAVVLVLLVAAANLANLLLAKGASRSREMAVRATLGASRGRLARQLLTETLVLCALGGAGGVLVANALMEVAEALLGASLPSTAALTLDLRVLAFAGVAVLGVALGAGLVPAWQTSAIGVPSRLKDAGRGATRGRDRVRSVLVVAEVGVSLVLVCGALLLARSLAALHGVDTGVRVERVTTMEVDLPVAAYPTAERAASLQAALADRLRAIPGVERVALATDLPLEAIGAGEAIILSDEGGPDVRYKRVDAAYFDLFGIPLVEGRGIRASDTRSTPRVVVVNEVLARQLKAGLGTSDLVGRVVRLTTPDYVKKAGTLEEVQVVGIIRNEQVDQPQAAVPPVAYVSIAQTPPRGLKVLIQTRPGVALRMADVLAAAGRVDPRLPLANVRSMAQVRDEGLAGARQPTWLLGVFAITSASLAALGLYGLMASIVGARRREIGIKMALGATGRAVLAQVLRHGLSIVGIGVGVGLAGALALTRLLESLLFGVSALDPAAFLAAALVMLAVGLLAAFLPASRAASVDPVAALRADG